MIYDNQALAGVMSTGAGIKYLHCTECGGVRFTSHFDLYIPMFCCFNCNKPVSNVPNMHDLSVWKLETLFLLEVLSYSIAICFNKRRGRLKLIWLLCNACIMQTICFPQNGNLLDFMIYIRYKGVCKYI